jgi:hypothetical protein
MHATENVISMNLLQMSCVICNIVLKNQPPTSEKNKALSFKVVHSFKNHTGASLNANSVSEKFN